MPMELSPARKIIGRVCREAQAQGWVIAQGKAHTAAFRRPTTESAERLEGQSSFLAALGAMDPGIVAGGVGVSVGTGTQDEQCTRAGWEEL